MYYVHVDKIVKIIQEKKELQSDLLKKNNNMKIWIKRVFEGPQKSLLRRTIPLKIFTFTEEYRLDWYVIILHLRRRYKHLSHSH